MFSPSYLDILFIEFRTRLAVYFFFSVCYYPGYLSVFLICCPHGKGLLECTDENTLTKVTTDPTRTCTLLDPTLTKKEDLIREVKVRGNLVCSNHELVEDSARREQGKCQNHIPGFRRDFGFFRYLLRKILCEGSIPRAKGPWEPVVVLLLGWAAKFYHSHSLTPPSRRERKYNPSKPPNHFIIL